MVAADARIGVLDHCDKDVPHLPAGSLAFPRQQIGEQLIQRELVVLLDNAGLVCVSCRGFGTGVTEQRLKLTK